MKLNFIFKIAIRYFFASKNERLVSLIAGFSMLGITIGVAALIVVMSVMNGFHIELTRNIIGLNGEITITSTTNKILNYPKLIKDLDNFTFVRQARPLITGQALAVSSYNTRGVIIKGIRLPDLKQKHQIKLTSGNFVNFTGYDKIAIGRELATNLGVGVGDKIKLLSTQLISTAFGSIPRAKDFTVIATFTSGFYDYDTAIIITTLEAAAHFFSLENAVNEIEIDTISPHHVNQFSQNLRNNIEQNYIIRNWQKIHTQFLNALKVERISMLVILSLIIIVAAFNIISSLFMLVKEKTKDIAILRTIGASKTDILLIFISNGTIIGALGTGLGGMLGVLLASNVNNIKHWIEKLAGIKLFEPAVYFLYNLPAQVVTSDVVLICSTSFGLSVLSTIYPAYRAAKLNPIEAIRYE